MQCRTFSAPSPFLKKKLCGKNVRGNSKAVCCDVCDNWVHIKCNGISACRYDELCKARSKNRLAAADRLMGLENRIK